MTAFEKAASEQGAAHAADGTSTEAPATVDADGVPRLPLDDAIKLLVRAVQEVISLYLPHILPISPYNSPIFHPGGAGGGAAAGRRARHVLAARLQGLCP